MNLPGMPSNLCSREFLRIGGGYNAPALGLSPAGGLDADHAGNLAMDGDLTVAGDASLGGEILTPGLHNGGGTGSAGALASGSCTLAAAGMTNCTSFESTGPCSWSRVGQVVQASARIGVNPAAGGTLTEFRLSLPVASALSESGQLSGSGGAIAGGAFAGALLSAETSHAEACVQFFSSGTGTHWLSLFFQYEVR